MSLPCSKPSATPFSLTVTVLTMVTGPCATRPPLSLLPFIHSAPDTSSSLLLLDPTRHAPTSRPLHWLFPLLGMLFPQITIRPTPLPPSGLCSNFTAQGSQAAPSLSSWTLLFYFILFYFILFLAMSVTFGNSWARYQKSEPQQRQCQVLNHYATRELPDPF